MISNVVSFLPTILGLAWSGTTVIPVIECAVRAIWHFGELSANRAQYHTCSVEKIYVEEKNQFIKDIEADFNSKLPTSCLPDVNQPDAPKLKLKFVNSEDPLFQDNLDVDLETSKLFCGTIKDFLSDNPDATEYLIPYFSEKNKMYTDDILKNYLTDRSNLNLTALNDEVLLETYDLARCLDMPDLEAKCMATIVKRFIKTESIVLKDGLEGLDHRYAKEFNRLFDNVDQLKTGHLSKALVTRLNDYNNAKLEVIKKIGKAIICGLLFIPLPLFPLAIKYIPFPAVNAHLVGIARFNIRCMQLYYPMTSYTIICAAILSAPGNTAIFLTTYPAANRIANIFLNVLRRFFLGTPVGRVILWASLALGDAIIFTATIIKDGTIFLAQSIIQASGFIYNKIGQGLQQIPTAVTTGLIGASVILLAAKQFG